MKLKIKNIISFLYLLPLSLSPGANVINTSNNTCNGQNMNCEQFSINNTGDLKIFNTTGIPIKNTGTFSITDKLSFVFAQKKDFKNGITRQIYTLTPSTGAKKDHPIQVLFWYFDPESLKDAATVTPPKVYNEVKKVVADNKNLQIESILKIYRTFSSTSETLVEWVDVDTFIIPKNIIQGQGMMAPDGTMVITTKIDEGNVIQKVIDLTKDY